MMTRSNRNARTGRLFGTSYSCTERNSVGEYSTTNIAELECLSPDGNVASEAVLERHDRNLMRFHGRAHRIVAYVNSVKVACRNESQHDTNWVGVCTSENDAFLMKIKEGW